MQEQHGAFAIRSLWRPLAVSRRGSYEGRRRPARAQTDADQGVRDTIQGYLAQGRGPYGTRRLKPLLAQAGLRVSRRRLGRVLAQAGLRGTTPRQFTAPRSSEQAQTIAPHQLHRACTVQVPDTIYVGDIP